MDKSTSNTTTAAPTTEPLPSELLLVVFIHGFKGADTSFVEFPQRLQHILSEAIRDIVVESVIFPAYETKGELDAAVVHFADWLTNLTVQREVANGLGGGAGKAKVVLCGHSMGGLLAADALIEFVRTRPDAKAPLWPNIISCLTFDTPYLGLHPSVFKNSATQAATYIRNAREAFSNLDMFGARTSPAASAAANMPKAAIEPPPIQATTSVWQKWAPAAYAVGGAVIAGAAAGTAYYKRKDIGTGFKWATDHMQFVGALWQESTLQNRLKMLLEIEEHVGVVFRTFYTFLPASPPSYSESRTFIILPRPMSPLAKYFLQAPNTIAWDEIQAHTGMFDSKTNDGYYELGLSVAQLIRGAVEHSRGALTNTHAEVVGATPPAGCPAVTILLDPQEGRQSEANDSIIQTPG
ncbi:hypothetical protein SCP_0206330 [Sparassis crispa]|uniref:AB hydrolase-1 domain-containing protein n=1 Tax=Sparassis crispa TaxID=139825 RepID=A0A401GB95_9APHY|nr:hypothetical protein SCP_0206330 [Sparassis crispa]GBE79435.1 hypothetical protein SCP_0206330 [Sparassis crispa]